MESATSLIGPLTPTWSQRRTSKAPGLSVAFSFFLLIARSICPARHTRRQLPTSTGIEENRRCEATSSAGAKGSALIKSDRYGVGCQCPSPSTPPHGVHSLSSGTRTMCIDPPPLAVVPCSVPVLLPVKSIPVFKVSAPVIVYL